MIISYLIQLFIFLIYIYIPNKLIFTVHTQYNIKLQLQYMLTLLNTEFNYKVKVTPVFLYLIHATDYHEFCDCCTGLALYMKGGYFAFRSFNETIFKLDSSGK